MEAPLWPCMESHIHTSPCTSQNLTFPSHKVGRGLTSYSLDSGAVQGWEMRVKLSREALTPASSAAHPSLTPVLSVLSTLIQLLGLKKAARPNLLLLSTRSQERKEHAKRIQSTELFAKRKILSNTQPCAYYLKSFSSLFHFKPVLPLKKHQIKVLFLFLYSIESLIFQHHWRANNRVFFH